MRERVLNEMVNIDKPLTPYEMRDILNKEGFKADVVTLYRVFDVLESLGLVHKISSLGRFVACKEGVEEKNLAKCHHYAICDVCGKIVEVEGEDLSLMEHKIERDTGFKIGRHYLEFSGICLACQKKNK